jgi:hypothetical protein
MKPMRRMWSGLLATGVLLIVLRAAISTASTQPSAPGSKEGLTMNREQASAFARLALKGLSKEFPNKPADVLNSAADVQIPRSVHPAFYGCYDWHSSVHGHWMLVRLLRRVPDLPEAGLLRRVPPVDGIARVAELAARWDGHLNGLHRHREPGRECRVEQS